MQNKIIADVRAEWHEEEGTIWLIAETLDGDDEVLGYREADEPTFATAENIDDSDYEYWYNEAVDEAHFQGYVLEGELEDECDMEPMDIIYEYLSTVEAEDFGSLAGSMLSWMGEDDAVGWFFHSWFANDVSDLERALGKEKAKAILDAYDRRG